MKSFCLILLLFTARVAYPQFKGESWERVKAAGAGTLTVVYYEQPGLIQKVDGKMKGVCVDLLTEFSNYVKQKYGKDLKISYAQEEKDFQKFLKTIQTNNNVLGVTNTSITEERKKILKFSPPYMSTQLVLLTNEKSPALKSLSDLPKVYSGFTAEIISGSTHEKQLEKIRKEHFPGLKVSYASSSESIIRNLSVNPKVFSILDFTEYIGVVRKKLPVKRQEVEIGAPEELGFIMSKQSDWDVLWNEFLTPEFRKGATYKKIVAENLGGTFLSLIR